MRKTKQTLNLQSMLLSSGVDPVRLKSLLEETIEMEYTVLYANRNKIPDDQFLNKELTMVEAKIFCLMLSQS